MNEVFVLDEEFTFDGPVHELTSISIEHKYDVDSGNCNGEFIISGDYREHDISISKEDFSFHLPFNNEVRSNVNLDSVEVEINDFTYEFEGDKLKTHVEYSINGEQALIEFMEEADLDEFLKHNEAEIVTLSEERTEEANETNIIEVEETAKPEILRDEITNNKEELPAIEEPIEEPERKEVIIKPEIIEEAIESKIEMNEEKNESDPGINKESIISSINSDDSYVTYNVHTITSADTFETISNQYNITINDIKNINNIDELAIGMKIIIPDEED